jgi:hypothetical protein
MPFLRRVLFVILFLLIFLGVVFFIEPPTTWAEASSFQILILFIPLLLLLTFFVNLFLNFFQRSFALALGVFIIIVTQALDQLNFLTVILIASAIGMLLWLIPKSRLTKVPKIPKLSRLERFRRR